MKRAILPFAIVLRWFFPLFLIGFGAVYIIQVQRADATNGALLTAAPTIHGDGGAGVAHQFPVRLTIDSIHLDLDIRPGSYDTKSRTWTLDDRNAFFIAESATPIIYGHNRPAVFGNLSKVGNQGVVNVYYQDGSMKRYLYYGTRFVAPDDMTVLRENDPRMVILFTCQGAFSDSRRLVYFKELSA